MSERSITTQEEAAYRLCHGDFGGLSKVDAAKQLGVTVRRVQQLLANIQRKAPSLPMVLAPQQYRVQALINDNGCTFEQIAIILNISESAVASTVQSLKDKGVFLERRKKTMRYENHLDNQIRQVF